MWYKVCQWLATGRWLSPGTPVSPTNRTDCHNISEILLKVALNTRTLKLKSSPFHTTTEHVTFSNISVISWRSVYGGGNRRNRRKPPTCRKSLTNLITQCCIKYTSPWAGFELTTSVVIDTTFQTMSYVHGWGLYCNCEMPKNNKSFITWFCWIASFVHLHPYPSLPSNKYTVLI